MRDAFPQPRRVNARSRRHADGKDRYASANEVHCTREGFPANEEATRTRSRESSPARARARARVCIRVPSAYVTSTRIRIIPLSNGAQCRER